MNCLVFPGYKDKDGYGRVHSKGRTFGSHRVAYEKHHGPIPDGLQVRHKCDNPSCVNPEHLELGTHADNMRDRCERGRTATTSQPGEKNGMAVLSDNQRNSIIDALRKPSRGLSSELALKFGVSRQTISRIKLGEGL